ncbi:unnamed protein product [Clavelina lepadiformis]|uniref:Uncharacterized protein n=1 Tax=Clavelina lepadiformis TaxID=159417 RepID=A0ABP0GAA3_CLALP
MMSMERHQPYLYTDSCDVIKRERYTEADQEHRKLLLDQVLLRNQSNFLSPARTVDPFSYNTGLDYLPLPPNDPAPDTDPSNEVNCFSWAQQPLVLLRSGFKLGEKLPVVPK